LAIYKYEVIRSQIDIKGNVDVNGIVQPSEDAFTCAFIAFINIIFFLFTKRNATRAYFQVNKATALREYVAGLAKSYYDDRENLLLQESQYTLNVTTNLKRNLRSLVFHRGLVWQSNSCTWDVIRVLLEKAYLSMATGRYIEMRRDFRSDFPDLMNLFNEYWAKFLDFTNIRTISMKWIIHVLDTPQYIQNNRFFHVTKCQQNTGLNTLVEVRINIYTKYI
jgi:hypothetical protein